MSIAVLIAVHDGLVLAADSATTLVVSENPDASGVYAANVYDNANKIFNLVKGHPLGCVTFGSGSIGNASIATLIKDFRKDLSVKKTKENPQKNKYGFDIDNYTMEEVCKHFATFLKEECDKLVPAERAKISIGLLIGGYSSGSERLGESWALNIVSGELQEPQKLREKDQAGMNWGGMSEVIQRIVLGYGSQIFKVFSEIAQTQQDEASLQAMLQPILNARLQAPLVFAPMPIQDAIDLGRFLVHSAIMFSRFLPGAQSVGGPIEIAAITKHEGFKWISRKHYYEQNLNKEPAHVVVDD